MLFDYLIFGGEEVWKGCRQDMNKSLAFSDLDEKAAVNFFINEADCDKKTPILLNTVIYICELPFLCFICLSLFIKSNDDLFSIFS